jgi:hypothetical protein
VAGVVVLDVEHLVGAVPGPDLRVDGLLAIGPVRVAVAEGHVSPPVQVVDVVQAGVRHRRGLTAAVQAPGSGGRGEVPHPRVRYPPGVGVEGHRSGTQRDPLHGRQGGDGRRHVRGGSDVDDLQAAVDDLDPFHGGQGLDQRPHPGLHRELDHPEDTLTLDVEQAWEPGHGRGNAPCRLVESRPPNGFDLGDDRQLCPGGPDQVGAVRDEPGDEPPGLGHRLGDFGEPGVPDLDHPVLGQVDRNLAPFDEGEAAGVG